MGSNRLGFTEGELQRESCQEGGLRVTGVAGWNLEWNLPGEICLNWAGWVG